MNKRFKKMLVYGGAVVLLSPFSIIYAQSPDESAASTTRHREKARQNLVKELNLTPQQQEQLEKQRNQQRKGIKALRDKLKAKRLELKQALEKQDIDNKKVYAVVAEIQVLMGEQLRQRVEGILSTKKILTPGQFQKLQGMIKQRREKVKQRLRQRGGRRGSLQDRGMNRF